MFSIHRVGGKAGQERWGVFDKDEWLIHTYATEEEAKEAVKEMTVDHKEKKK